MKPLCIFHGNCADGFGAAWVVRNALGADNVDFHFGIYNNVPPDVTDRHVIFVDFCYQKPVMLELLKSAASILVLDHHDTAMKAMKSALTTPENYTGVFELPPNATWEEYRKDLTHETPSLRGKDREMWLHFDMERSGAGLTWDFFNPGQPRPRVINHIEDRDLWRFRLRSTREIQASMFALPYDFEIWDDRIWSANSSDEALQEIITEGAALERKHHKDIAELVQVVTRPMKFRAPWLDGPAPADLGFIVVPMANLPYTLTSDAGEMLCNRNWYGRTPEQQEEYVKNRRGPAVDPGPYTHYFAGCYWVTSEGVVFSLRSPEDGADVGAIASLYGGGGHRHASGFRVPLARLPEFEP